MQQLGSTQSQHADSISNYKTINDLPPEVLRLIFTFLGIGYFRFIGGTSRLTSVVYYCKRTTIESVVSSVSCVELYLQEAGNGIRQLRLILHGGAASYGRLDILEWAHQRGYLNDCSEERVTCVYCAATHGILTDMWLKDHRCPLPSAACNNASRHGHLNILQWLRANECPWDEYTCSFAAGSGRLDILQWLRANGCPWNEDTCFRAAAGGHLHIL
jgi:hypothetical protein